MTYYLLYDAGDSKPYGLLTSTGLFSHWQPAIEDILSTPLTSYTKEDDVDIPKYLANPDYPIVATFDCLPTLETHPELLL